MERPVESSDLTQFYSRVTDFPKTQTELSDLAEKISALVPGAFTAILLRDGEKFKVAINLEQRLRSQTANLETVENFLVQEVRQNGDERRAEPKQIQIAGNESPFGRAMSDFFLTIAPMRKSGFVVFGTEKSFSTKEEILVASIVSYLSDLLQIGDLKSGIQLRNQFLSIASHELKTPLTSIYGILQLQERMLRLKKEDSPQAALERQQSFLKMVIRQVERLNELIDGLLDVSRIQNGRFVVEPSETDVAVLLREATSARLNVIAQEAGVKLKIESPEKLVAWVDPVRMEEVLNNLIMNAIRFSPEGGVVWIRLSEDGTQLNLTIRDQGPSVPVEDRERIFQPFERAQRTGRLGGLGLGLFISREIAQLHGGAVNLIESIPGKGNVFEAKFPLRSISRISA